MLKPCYYVDKGTYKDIIRDDKSLFCCPFCGEWFRALAYHTRQKHGIKAKELRQMMGLKSNYQLITPDLKSRHKEIVKDNFDTHVKNNLINKGNKTRYLKGHEGHLKEFWSPEAIEEIKTRGRKQFLNLIHKRRLKQNG